MTVREILERMLELAHRYEEGDGSEVGESIYEMEDDVRLALLELDGETEE